MIKIKSAARKVRVYRCNDCGDIWPYSAKGRPPKKCHICGGEMTFIEKKPV